ncbi:hypothetical protein GF380_04680 [Candidatus Uhrbacteria bacterium]|nr:hypothetical protein [Candidatus Uhrbacteria bacterium]MBD3284351.1 hypothetical protein [Candidatus Uhrbacteria bacterium]
MTTNVVTDEQLGAFSRRQHELFHRVRKGALSFEVAMATLQQLLDGKRSGIEERSELNALTTITIPSDATAEQLIADAKAALEQVGIPFTYFDDDVISIIRRDLELVKGKTLEVLQHCFDHDWTTVKGRVLQRGQGFEGNAAAFLVWVTQAKWKGRFVSIAYTDDRLFPGSGALRAPYFDRDEQSRRLDLFDVDCKWSDDDVLVAFRAI